MAVAEIVRKQRAPAGGETDAAVEIFVQPQNLFDVESIGSDQPLASGIAAGLASGMSVVEACERAKRYIVTMLGDGFTPP